MSTGSHPVLQYNNAAREIECAYNVTAASLTQSTCNTSILSGCVEYVHKYTCLSARCPMFLYQHCTVHWPLCASYCLALSASKAEKVERFNLRLMSCARLPQSAPGIRALKSLHWLWTHLGFESDKRLNKSQGRPVRTLAMSVQPPWLFPPTIYRQYLSSVEV